MDERPLPTAPDASTALLEAAPAPLLQVDAGGRLVWANAAARALCGAMAGAAASGLWREPAAAAVLWSEGAQADLELAGAVPRRVHASSRALPAGGWVLHLHPLPQPDADAGAELLEPHLALAVELAGIAIWRHDLATDRMHYNAQAYKILGMTPRPDGMALADVRARVHPDDLALVERSARAALLSDRPTDMEARYRRSDGQWRHLMSRRVVQRAADGKPLAFIGAALDVTDRVGQTRKAEEIAHRLELVTRTAGIGYWVREPGAERATWSEPLRALVGLRPDEPAPDTQAWLDRYVHPEDRAEAQRTFSEWKRSGRSSLDLSFRIRRSDGTVRHLQTHTCIESGSGQPVLFGVVIDLTSRRSADIALRSAVERVGLAARGAGLGTWEVDRETGEVFWDAQMWALRGRAPQPRPMTEAEHLATIHPDDRAALHESVAQAMDTGVPLDHEFRVIWPDGQVRWLASRSVEVRDELAGTHRRIGVNWDVTDKRTAEAVRQERAIALRESQGKSKFLARMSHELRTPLNAVLGFSQLLLADERGSDPAAASRRRRLEHIRSAGRHLLTLINDVLDLSSLEGGEMRIALQPVVLAPLVAQTLPLLGPLHDSLRETLRVSVRTGALDGVVLADATRLRQVLLNLLSNAVKYNRDGGTVVVEAQPRGASVLLRVADTGRGMSDEQLRHLFEPFNRLGRDRGTVEGSGIGLAIVKALVERMGGSVHVDSTVGVGSVFEVRLAAADAEQVTAPAAEAMPTTMAGELSPLSRPADPAPAPARGRRRVLYVEDNPVNAMIISELMARRSDLALEIAVDGASGVAQATALLPDLILLDMQLPDFDGFEVLRRLRAQPATAGIPCIALSANAMPADIERALHAGVSDYWTKPLDFKAFMASLDALFGKG